MSCAERRTHPGSLAWRRSLAHGVSRRTAAMSACRTGLERPGFWSGDIRLAAPPSASPAQVSAMPLPGGTADLPAAGPLLRLPGQHEMASWPRRSRAARTRPERSHATRTRISGCGTRSLSESSVATTATNGRGRVVVVAGGAVHGRGSSFCSGAAVGVRHGGWPGRRHGSGLPCRRWFGAVLRPGRTSRRVFNHRRRGTWESRSGV